MRQLLWSAEARRQEEWDRTAATQAWLSRVMTGAKIDPSKLNPYRQVRRARSGPATAAEDAAAWALLDAHFGR